MDKMEAAKIINAVDVIGMGVGEEYGVDVGNMLSDYLLSQIGGGVDKNVFATVFYDD
ncbi:hypothetical protein JCM15764A_23850 [Geotalea toluenoxydans]